MVELVMPAIIKQANAIAEQNPRIFTAGHPPLFQLDNASIHRFSQTQLAQMGITAEQLVPHPPLSPDFNRCVEHAHPQLVHTFDKYLSTHPDLSTPFMLNATFRWIANAEHGYTPWLKLMGFKPAVTQSSVERDFKGLPELWENVISKNGDYADKRFR
jgi:hypothetical protein